MAEYHTDITVYGTKENIIRMLNAAIRNVGNGTISLIEEGDDEATINEKFKIKEGIGWSYLDINVSDLLDEVCLKDSQLQAKKEAFFREHNGDGWKPIEIGGVEILETGCVAYFRVGYWGYKDWLDWDEIARLYECSICIDEFEDIPDYHQTNSFQGTTIIEYKNGSVEKTLVEPDIGFDLNIRRFDDEFDKLIQFDPIRYRKLMIQQYDEILSFVYGYLEEEIRELKLTSEWNMQLKTHGGEIDQHYQSHWKHCWDSFVCAENDGVDEVKQVFERIVSDNEGFTTTLRLRAERWKGENDELAQFYEQLPAKIPEALEARKKAEEEEEAKRKLYENDDLSQLPF